MAAGGETVNAEQIADELGKACQTQIGWTCLCPAPAHDDHDPSFSIADGDDGNLLFNCFAGCEAGDIIVALKSRGLWPESVRGGNFRKRPVATTPKRETRATAAYASQIWVRAKTKNNKGRAPNRDATPESSDSRTENGTDPLIGWFNLAKPSRNRQQKRGWQRGARK